jgi:hypothetical protein
MSPEIMHDLAPILGFVAFGMFVLSGMKMWFSHRRAMRSQLGSAELDQVLEEVAGLRDEVRALRGGLAELEERVDFAERLLAKPRVEVAAEPPRRPAR